MNSNWLAFKVMPGQNNIEKISLSLVKTGKPTSGPASFYVVGDNGSGDPNFTDVRAKGTLSQETLQALPSSGTTWTEIGFDIKGGIGVSPREELFIVVQKYGTATNTFKLEYKSSAGIADYWTSTDNVTWNIGSTGKKFLYRLYANNSIDLVLEDLTAKMRYGSREIAFSLRQDIQQETAIEALIQASEVISREQRVYSNIIVSPTTDAIPLGKYCRIVESATGLDKLVDIVGVDLSMSSDGESNLGATQITLTLLEVYN